MSLPDTIFIFGLALVIFGPKKLPEIGRQLGKLVLEFRRASNEFKMQIEEELNAAERADRQKEIAAQAAKSVTTPDPIPASIPEPSPEPSGALTIRPPSNGITVSADAPSRVIPVHDEAAGLEAVAGEHQEPATNGLPHQPERATLQHD
jgi:sec-independent protein translocase protein TatB